MQFEKTYQVIANRGIVLDVCSWLSTYHTGDRMVCAEATLCGDIWPQRSSHSLIIQAHT
ncbi:MULTISPECIES: hypothetical protein [unclassified Pseudomonas]|uniref:hypothetical protein n=1 Tax=unclassified Pseudomonas TaxID=196821 RepID=UPI001304CD4F|nr:MULTISPECIES: hypothetical protein [unclassified Pseudomonas]